MVEPATNGSVRGRILVASGAALSIFAPASGSSLANRSCTSKNTACRRLCTRFCVGRGDEAIKCAASTLRRIGDDGLMSPAAESSRLRFLFEGD